MTRLAWPRVRTLAFRGRSEQLEVLGHISIPDIPMPYAGDHVTVQFEDVSIHFAVQFPIWFSRTPSSRRGPTPTQPTPVLRTGCLGRTHRSGIASARLQRGYIAPSPSPHSWPRSRARDRGRLEHGCEARSRCRSRLGRDRHHPLGPAHVRRLIRAERLEGSRTASAAPSMYFPDQSPETRPRRGHVEPLRPCASTGRRDSPRRRLAHGSSPEIGGSMALPCWTGALACTTNEAR
jgi:hypothetical protein